MMKSYLAVLALSLGFATAAFAETPCPAAQGAIVPLAPTEGDKDFFLGLAVSLQLGLDPASFPKEDIKSANNACSRGSFEISGTRFVISGADQDLPPRWAVGDRDDRIAFLAMMPPPSVALKWARSRGKQKEMSFTEPPVFVLAVTNGAKRDIYAVLTRMPGDPELTSLFQRALDGSLKPFARYDTSTGETEPVAQ